MRPDRRAVRRRVQCRERGHEGGLDRVLHDLDVPDAGHARERRDQPAVLVAEEMLDQAGAAASGSSDALGARHLPDLDARSRHHHPALSFATSIARS